MPNFVMRYIYSIDVWPIRTPRTCDRTVTAPAFGEGSEIRAPQSPHNFTRQFNRQERYEYSTEKLLCRFVFHEYVPVGS